MHEHNEREPTMGQRLNSLLAWAQCLAMPVELFLRKPGTAGERYFCGRVCIGIFLMIVVIALVGGEGRGFRDNYTGPIYFPDYQPPKQEVFAPGKYDGFIISAAFYGAALMLVMHKGQEQKNKKDGKAAWHSIYTGESWLGLDDWKVKQSKEPALVFLLGCLSLVVSAGLGTYLLLASFCLGITTSNQRMEFEAKRRAMRDARAESQMYMEDFR